MNYELFIARRLLRGREGRHRLTGPVIRIALTGIALGMAVMLLAVMIVTGFRREISEKVMGFGGHIRIGNFDFNNSFEEEPIALDSVITGKLSSHPDIVRIQPYATKAGIIRTGNDIHGVVLKGIDESYESRLFSSSLHEGRFPDFSDSTSLNAVVISLSTARRMQLHAGDDMIVHFIDDPPRVRKLKIAGVYNTGLEEFDERFAFCHLDLIRKLNHWNSNQAGGLELLIRDLKRLNPITDEVYYMAGYQYDTQNIREQYPQVFHWLDLQNVNVIIIITLILLIAGVSMISTLLILILENTTMIGIMKALGATDASMRKIFIYVALPVIGVGLLAGNLIGLGLGGAQAIFGFIPLPEESYYVKTVPIYFSLMNILLLNVGTLFVCFLMLIGPSMVITRILPARVIRYD